MALTDAERVKVRRYLGYSVLAPTNDWVGRTLTDLATRPAAEAEVQAILAAIADVDEAIAAASSSTSRAGLKRVEDVEFFGGPGALSTMTADRDRLISELSDLLGIPRASSGARNGGAMMRG